MTAISSQTTTLDPSVPLPEVAPRAGWNVRILPPLGLVALLVGFTAMLWAFYRPAILHPDANGYWAQGSLIFETGRSWFRPQSNAQYIGMHWLLLGDNTFLSRYPPGFPLLIGLVQHTLGWEATMWINPILSLLTIVGVYLAVARLASPAFGLLAAAALAMNGAFAVHALTEISHTAVAFCVVWGIYFLMRWSASGNKGWVFAAGLVLGCIPSIRYADAIIALGVAVFLLSHVRRFDKIHLHYLAAIAGAAVSIVPLLIRNQLLLGAFWRTGYALTNEQTGFSLEWFRLHAFDYLQMLAGGGIGPMFALGLAGLVWMLFLPRTRALAAMLLLMIVPFIITYMAYYWASGVGAAGNAGGMRFMVPIVPMAIIPAAWLLSEALRGAPRAAQVAVPVTLLALIGTTYGSNLFRELSNNRDRKTALALATKGLEQVAEKDAVVVASPALLQQLDFVRQWKLADSSVISGRGSFGGGRGGRGFLPGGGGPGGPGGDDNENDRPSPQQQAKNEARAKLYTGTTAQKQKQFQDDLLAWAAGKPIYVIGAAADLDRLIPGVDGEAMTIVERIATPKAPEAENESRGGNLRGRNAGGPPGGGPGGPGGAARGRGGPFGNFVAPGEDIVIARWEPHATDMLSIDDFR